MSASYYRLALGLGASVSLLLAGCSANRPSDEAIPIPPSKFAAAAPKPAPPPPDEIDTESTIWTILGLARKPSAQRQGPQVGDEVSPSLWVAAHDALKFAGIASEDPMAGYLVSEWYSPPGKPNERLRVTVLILSRALRADSLGVRVDREERSPSGGWTKSTVAQKAVSDMETAILQRARQIHAELYRNMM